MSRPTATSPSPIAERAAILAGMMVDERWTDRSLAARIGVSHTYIAARRKGNVDLTYSDLDSLAPVFRLTIEELVRVLAGNAKFTPGAAALEATGSSV